MSNDQFSQKDLKNLCRTCMSSNSSLTPLFAVLSLSNREEALDSILYKCTSIRVTETDVLPQGICNSCLEKLAMCYLFRELCYNTQNKLLQLYETQKQLVNYIIIQNNSPIDIVQCINSDSSTEDFAEHINFPTDGDYVTEHKELISETKQEIIESHNIENKANFNESCDFETLGCDKQNYIETDNDNKNIKESLVLACHICFKQFASKYSLNRHLKIHTNPENLKCTVCMKTFTRASDVKRHMSLHTGEKPYSCSICDSSFTQSGTLTSHLKKHEEFKEIAKIKSEKAYLCSMCGKSFRHSSTLKVHLRRHVGEKPYECDICKLCFVSSGRLQSHRRVHTGERPYICHICNKSFAHLSIISRHLKAHADYKPHKCSYCSKHFSTVYYLNIHTRQHTGEKPLNCSTCTKPFACPKNLKQHEKIHLDLKPYSCLVCGKSFRRSHHLKCHMKQHNKIS